MQTINQATMDGYHKSIDKLFNRINDAGHNGNAVTNISLRKTTNSQSGEHVHATCTIKLRFDESVQISKDTF